MGPNVTVTIAVELEARRPPFLIAAQVRCGFAVECLIVVRVEASDPRVDLAGTEGETFRRW